MPETPPGLTFGSLLASVCIMLDGNADLASYRVAIGNPGDCIAGWIAVPGARFYVDHEAQIITINPDNEGAYGPGPDHERRRSR